MKAHRGGSGASSSVLSDLEGAERSRRQVPMVRIEPDRRWFGNTRVLAQSKLQQFAGADHHPPSIAQGKGSNSAVRVEIESYPLSSERRRYFTFLYLYWTHGTKETGCMFTSNEPPLYRPG